MRRLILVISLLFAVFTFINALNSPAKAERGNASTAVESTRT